MGIYEVLVRLYLLLSFIIAHHFVLYSKHIKAEVPQEPCSISLPGLSYIYLTSLHKASEESVEVYALPAPLLLHIIKWNTLRKLPYSISC